MPVRPVVAHASALTNVADLGISMEINGEIRQDSRTSRMIFPIPEDYRASLPRPDLGALVSGIIIPIIICTAFASQT
jgi:hypothetical protein